MTLHHLTRAREQAETAAARIDFATHDPRPRLIDGREPRPLGWVFSQPGSNIARRKP